MSTEYLALITTCIANLAIAMEICMPGMIAQQISCDLRLPMYKENALVLGSYMTSVVAVVAAVPVIKLLSARIVLITCAYICVAVGSYCVATGTFASVMVYRITIGACISLIQVSAQRYTSFMVSCKEYSYLAIMLPPLFQSVGFILSGISAYIFMGILKWQFYIAVTSVTQFTLTIFLLHFVLPDLTKVDIPEEERRLIRSSKPPELACLLTRTMKVSFVSAFSGVVNYSIMIVVTSVIKDFNTRHLVIPSSCSAIYGGQYFIVSGIIGICNIIGQTATVFFHGKVSSLPLIIIASILSFLISVVCNVYLRDEKLLMVWLGLLQTVLGTLSQEIHFMVHDTSFYSSRYLSLSRFVHVLVTCYTCLLGNTISQIVCSTVVVKVYLYMTACTVFFSLLLFLRD